ncbi:YncE family protein [Chitinophaga sp. MM2321]|uniref:YncE family protein n=1 Tax=Chitinophaga sp. MM2321 TaxID=3137178 RepID=UPI0032D573F5
MKLLKFSLIAIMLLPSLLQAQSRMKVVDSFSLQGDGWWDYLTSGPDNKLYVSHGDQVNVIDKKTGKELAAIKDLSGVHGIALDVQSGKGFISNGRENDVVVFDTKNEQVRSKIKTGNNPDAIIFEPMSKTIITGNGRSNSLSVIDPVTMKIKATIDIGGKPEALVSDLEGNIYVNIEDKSEIAIVDIKTFKVKGRIKLLPAGEGPTGLAIDLKNKLLFVGCGNAKLLVVQLGNNSIIANISIGEDCDGVAYNAQSQTIYASCADGTLSVIKQTGNNKFQAEKAVVTVKGARTLALDEVTNTIYLSVANIADKKNDAGRYDVIPGSFKVLVVR